MSEKAAVISGDAKEIERFLQDCCSVRVLDHYHRFMHATLADVITKGTKYWPVGMSLIKAEKGDGVVDAQGNALDAYVVTVVAMPPDVHQLPDGEEYERQLELHGRVYQCAFQLDDDGEVVAFIEVKKPH